MVMVCASMYGSSASYAYGSLGSSNAIFLSLGRTPLVSSKVDIYHNIDQNCSIARLHCQEVGAGINVILIVRFVAHSNLRQNRASLRGVCARRGYTRCN